MRAYDQPQMRRHGRSEIAGARAMMAEHPPTPGALCVCLRVSPCPVYAQASAYLNYWLAREEAVRVAAALIEEAIAEAAREAMLAPTIALELVPA